LAEEGDRGSQETGRTTLLEVEGGREGSLVMQGKWRWEWPLGLSWLRRREGLSWLVCTVEAGLARRG